MTTHAVRLAKKIENKSALVGIVGLGYVGLPLVREFTASGFRVMGFDVDHRKVAMLKAGKTYIKHLPASMFKKLIGEGRFTPTSDMKQFSKPDCILICVPTPLNKMREPDMSYVRMTTEAIAKRLRRGQLVIL